MAITAYGFDGTVDEGAWARAHKLIGAGGSDEYVSGGFAVAPGAGTRGLTASASGSGYAPGVLAECDATAPTVTIAANTGTTNRIDYVVLKIDWAANTASVVVLLGSSATSLPALTRTAGTLWHIPLASITVRPAVTTILTSDIIDRRPTAKRMKVYTDNSWADTTVPTATPVQLASIFVPDPGWPHRLVISARATFAATAAGSCYLYVLNSAGTELVRANGERLDAARVVTLYEVSAQITGAGTYRLMAAGNGLTAAGVASGIDQNRYIIQQHPV